MSYAALDLLEKLEIVDYLWILFRQQKIFAWLRNKAQSTSQLQMQNQRMPLLDDVIASMSIKYSMKRQTWYDMKRWKMKWSRA